MEDKWEKVRLIVREECERIEQRILGVLENHGTKPKITFINGQWTGISQEQLSSWKIAYECDVDQELKKAAAWLTSNKQPKNFARFLNAWLSRSSERSLIRSIPTRNNKVEKMTCDYCGKPRTGVTDGIAHCSAHLRDALDGVPAKVV